MTSWNMTETKRKFVSLCGILYFGGFYLVEFGPQTTVGIITYSCISVAALVYSLLPRHAITTPVQKGAAVLGIFALLMCGLIITLRTVPGDSGLSQGKMTFLNSMGILQACFLLGFGVTKPSQRRDNAES